MSLFLSFKSTSTSIGFSPEELAVLNTRSHRSVHFCYFALLAKTSGVKRSHLETQNAHLAPPSTNFEIVAVDVRCASVRLNLDGSQRRDPTKLCQENTLGKSAEEGS